MIKFKCPLWVLAASLCFAHLVPVSASGDVAKSFVVEMKPCKMERSLVFFAGASKSLIRKGTVEVAGVSYDVYLPKGEYKLTPGASTGFPILKSTCLSVDQNHDGKLSEDESYYAEFPLRIGDSMFEIKGISDDGSQMTLAPSNSPLHGAAIGRTAPDVTLNTITGKKIRIRDFKGKIIVLDCWAPS